ncbi:MAG TPA: sigma-70 family RNA polymerase sigma factor [Pirellulaceae bacterium]|nr:sigma-70 family RNA polymerase sigma factor [Pirellulaceae bacterium]HMO94032.1 sigma-70 family RNA polymerase sigma factor [Pirellulaceae bacterium]HMP70902.1 sigma-70 family RNA polymerase sigma factor [Pirellulaceae bacterium]
MTSDPEKTNSNQPTASQNYASIDPDVVLMLQVQNDNAAAFEELMRRYQTRLRSIMEHLVPGSQQAEDLTQEVFMRVYRSRKTYQPQAKFSTWLFTIANNVAHNAIEKLSNRKEVHLSETPSGTFPTRALENIAKDASGLMPTRVLARNEQAEIIAAAIQSLNERQRMAVLLSKFEHMSYVDIAETMGLTTQAVKSLLARARVRLKELLSPYMQNGRDHFEMSQDQGTGQSDDGD